jgi:arylsulfatase A-like enzyme
MRRVRALIALTILVTLGACRDPQPVRVVLVTLDTLRYDSLVPAEGEGAESAMPRLLERSRAGVRFERFYAATSITQPSHASMLTALHPWEHGVVSNGQVLPERFVTVPEALREAGFATAAVVASFPVASRFGFGQGFDSFSEDFTEHPTANRRWEGHRVPEDRFYALADTVTDRALAALDAFESADRAGAGPARHQFLWVHYFDPHDPYGDAGGGPVYSPHGAFRLIERGGDPGPLLRQFRSAYDRDAAFLDRHLDRLLARLEADAGGYETHVVLASDHGESFGESGAIAHGMRLTEEQVRVPLVILSPRVEPGVEGRPAGSVDIARTLMSLAGVAADQEPWSGARDLTAPARSSGRGERRRGAGDRAGALGMRRTFHRAGQTELRTDGSRHSLQEPLFYAVDREGLIFRGNGAGLEEAPPEADPSTVGRVVALFGAFERGVEAGSAPAADDPEALEGLRALGYVN